MGRLTWTIFTGGTVATRRRIAAAVFVLVVAAWYFVGGGAAAIRRILPTKHNTLPATEIASGKLGLSRAMASGVPTILFEGIQTVTQSGSADTYADFILVNPLDVPIHYQGWARDSVSPRSPPGGIHPILRRQQKVAANAPWQDAPLAHCGTGVGNMVIPAKYAGRFRFNVDSEVLSTRIGVRCSWQSPSGEIGQVDILSPEF